MNELATITVWVLVGLVILQALPALAFTSLFRSPSPKITSDDPLPKVAVVLCLRGADPFLADCIRALLNQDYPQYKVHIVIDSRSDPAWKIVQEVIQQTGATHIQVSPLATKYESCSLRCSALFQAISGLDDSYEVVAMVDADVVTYPNWLRELVVPLADERVGATTGNRWYMPQTDQWGSLVRYLWNSAAVVTMYVHKYAWGGSIAIKLSVLRRARLLETLTQVLCDDPFVGRATQELGLKLKFVPTVMMVNREECDLGNCLRFLTRQHLWGRYQRSWLAIVVQVSITTLALVLATALLLIALVSGHFSAATLFGGGFIGYILAMGLLLALSEQGVRRVVQARGEPTTRFSALVMAKMLVAIPLTQLVCAVAMVSAMLMRSFEWRGVVYQIKGLWNVRLVKYLPYQPSSQPVDTNASL